MNFVELIGLMVIVLMAPHLSEKFADRLASVCLFAGLVVIVAGALK